MPVTFGSASSRSRILVTGAGPNWASTMRAHPCPYRLGVSSRARRLAAKVTVARTEKIAAVMAKSVLRIGTGRVGVPLATKRTPWIAATDRPPAAAAPANLDGRAVDCARRSRPSTAAGTALHTVSTMIAPAPMARVRPSTRIPGSGSATRATPIGNKLDIATATTTAPTAPTVPMTAARASVSATRSPGCEPMA